jgi:predicted MFS family arabinose efflux permease
MALSAVAAIGYAASLPLQERMVAHTSADTRGQALGLRGTGMKVWQALGALIAGSVADLMGVGPTAAAQTMAVMAVGSILVNLALARGLRRSAPGAAGQPLTATRAAIPG